MAIDTSNITFIDYLWTKKNDDNTITGIRLDKRNLPTDTVYSSSLNSKVNKSGDTMTGNLTPATNKGASLGTSSLYWSNIYGTTIYENGTSLANKYASKTNIPEAYLTWGGKNFSGSYGPIDAAMVPELGANRLAFMPADAVTIEYSRDGGSTWTDYGPTDPQKIDLFNGRGSSFIIGKASSGEGNIATNQYQLRVNIYTSAGRVYTALNKFVIYLSTSGTNNNWCTIRARKQSDYTAGNDTWTTFADKISVSGWSGYNVINTSGITTYGNTASSQYGHIQFIFGCDKGSTNNSYPGLQINKIFGFGGVGWTTPSTMAKTGHMYTYDSSQNVTFPAGVSAKSFTENGKTLSATYIAKSLTSTKGDMIYASAANTPARLGIGSNGQFLSIADGIPKWVNNPNSDTHYTNYLQIKGNGAEAVKFTQNADKSLNLKPGNNVSISAASGEITISATVPTKSSWNYDDTYVKYSAAQSLNDTQKTQARTNIGAGTITEIKVNGTSKGTSGSVNLTNMVTFASSQTATVAGTNKTTYTYNQPTGDSDTGSSNGSAYFPEGIIMGGTAASAGLVTRGICGVTTPNATTGACDKENLYINYDGNNDYQSNRQLVLQAGSVGNHYGNNLYQYAAARGDAVKSYCDATYAAKSHTHNYVATDTIATSTRLGLVKSSTTGTTENRDYNVQVNPDGTMKVNVPWTNTTYTFNGAVSTIKDNNLTANRALISNDSGKVAVSNITSTELSYLDGVSGNIQTQLNTLQGYFDKNGYAKVAVNAQNDSAGNDIIKTYATQKDLNLKQPKTLEDTGISISHDGTIVPLTTVEDAIRNLAKYVSSCYQDIKHWTPIEVNCATGVNISNFSLTDDLLTIIYNQMYYINDYERDLYINFDDGTMVLRLDHRKTRTGSDKCLLYTGHCEKDNVIYKVYLLLKDTGSTLTQTAVRIEEYATIS